MKYADNIIVNFLKTLRESFDNCVEVYTKGSCYQLFLILKSLHPEAVCWYDQINGHVYTGINGEFYDINGKHLFNVRWIRIENEPNILKQAKTWRYEGNK